MEHLLPDEPSIQTLIKVPEREREKEKHIWLTYLHNNVAPSLKQLRLGVDGGRRCTCAPILTVGGGGAFISLFRRPL